MAALSKIPAGVTAATKARCAEVVANVPGITHVWGGGDQPDHNNRRCIDFMVPTRAIGDQVVAYLRVNHVRLGINGLVWRRQVMGYPHQPNPPYRGPAGTWRPYSGKNPHLDHVHVEFDQTPHIPKAEPMPTKPALITVVSANILRRTDTTPRAGGNWARRRPKVVAAINSGIPDLVLLQEVDQVTAADIFAGLGQHWHYDRIKGLAIGWDSIELERTGDAKHVLYSDQDNRYLLSIPLRHKATGREFWADVTHLENDGGGTGDHGHQRRHQEMTELVKLTAGGTPRVLGADLNSTTRSSSRTNARQRQKPRPMLAAAGWWLLTDQTGVTNRQLESHHGGRAGGSNNGPWIDDAGGRGCTYQPRSGRLIRTDETDASDHNFLRFTVRL